jgi:hypothetical protein
VQIAIPIGTCSANSFAERSLLSRTNQDEIDTRNRISQKNGQAIHFSIRIAKEIRRCPSKAQIPSPVAFATNDAI